MSDEISTETSAQSVAPTTKSRKPSMKLVAILLAGVLVLAGGITLTTVSVANAAAEETARQCAVALEGSERAAKAAKASLAMADEALEQITSVTLPGDEAWTSTEYSARAGVEAVEAVAAVEASEGVEAVPAVEAVEARPSGAEHIASVGDARDVVAEIKLPTNCVERQEAAAITDLTTDAKTATRDLYASIAALMADFNAFQAEESARIAAEIEAARIAAEIEAARVAAEAAAAAEAERQRAAASRNTWGGSSGGSSGGSTGGSNGGSSRPPGGGQVGPGGGNGGVCWGSNGSGGLVQVPC